MNPASGEPPIDRRRSKTRQAIRAAFAELLLERGFGGFTINEVVARADVGRSTFYEHYKTRHALLADSLAGPLGGLASIIGSGQPASTLVPLLMHFRDQQALCRVLFLAPTRSLVSRVLADQIEARLAEVVVQTSGCDPILPLGLIAALLADAQLAIIEPWSLGRVSCRHEQIAEALVVATTAASAALLRLTPQQRQQPERPQGV